MATVGRAILQFRSDFFDIFNHPDFGNPVLTGDQRRVWADTEYALPYGRLRFCTANTVCFETVVLTSGSTHVFQNEAGADLNPVSSHLIGRTKYGGFASGKRANRERAGFLPAKQHQCLPMTVNCTDAEWESALLFPTTAKV